MDKFSDAQPVREWFKKQWEGGDYEVIDSALVQRRTLYGAIKKKSTGEVFCAVFLIRWSRDSYNFSYKDMTEHVDPVEISCPKRIMKLLTPLGNDNGYAREWRLRVEEYWKKRDALKKLQGCVIKTHKPVRFNSGEEYQYFQKQGRITMGGIMIDNEFIPCVRVRFNLVHFNYEIIPQTFGNLV